MAVPNHPTHPDLDLCDGGFWAGDPTGGAGPDSPARTRAAARGQVLATQSTVANAVALAPTLLAGVAIDLVGVRPVAFSVAGLLVLGAVLGRRIGGGQDTHARMVVPVAGQPPERAREGKKRR